MSFVESGSDREEVDVDVDVGVATPNDLPSEDEARDADEWVDEEDPGYFKIPFGGVFFGVLQIIKNYNIINRLNNLSKDLLL